MNNRALNVLGQLFILNIIYILSIVFSLGILIAPSTSALFYFTNKLLSKDYQEHGLIKRYWQLIKEKFKFSFIFGLIAFIIIYLCIVNLDNILLLDYPDFLRKIIIVSQYFILIEISIMTIMVLFLNGNFVFHKFSDLVKMAFYVGHRHIFTTIIMGLSITFIVYFFVFYVNAIFLILLFSLLAIWISLLYKPVCKRYIVIDKEEQNEEIDDDEK